MNVALLLIPCKYYFQTPHFQRLSPSSSFSRKAGFVVFSLYGNFRAPGTVASSSKLWDIICNGAELG